MYYTKWKSRLDMIWNIKTVCKLTGLPFSMYFICYMHYIHLMYQTIMWLHTHTQIHTPLTTHTCMLKLHMRMYTEEQTDTHTCLSLCRNSLWKNKPLACDQVPSITINAAPPAHSGCCGRLQISIAGGDTLQVTLATTIILDHTSFTWKQHSCVWCCYRLI